MQAIWLHFRQAREAAAAFEAAIEVARTCELPFLEMCAHRDYIVHVLDAEGRREEQLAALGRAISRMVLPPGEYTAVLGSDIDGEAAVAAFESHAWVAKWCDGAGGETGEGGEVRQLRRRPWRLE